MSDNVNRDVSPRPRLMLIRKKLQPLYVKWILQRFYDDDVEEISRRQRQNRSRFIRDSSEKKEIQ